MICSQTHLVRTVLVSSGDHLPTSSRHLSLWDTTPACGSAAGSGSREGKGTACGSGCMVGEREKEREQVSRASLVTRVPGRDPKPRVMGRVGSAMGSVRGRGQGLCVGGCGSHRASPTGPCMLRSGAVLLGGGSSWGSRGRADLGREGCAAAGRSPAASVQSH